VESATSSACRRLFAAAGIASRRKAEELINLRPGAGKRAKGD